MKDYLKEYIKDLSIKDKKTLSQKALKVTEEVGELAKVILPYDSAHCTNHRFVDKSKILEEIADVYLTNISIAYSLGITDDEIEEMISDKTKKWAELQANESKGEFPLPFEIHITTELEDMSDLSIDKFKTVCSEIGVKPIIIDLEINSKIHKSFIKQDVMTSSKFFGDNRGAYEESERISSLLKKSGYKVLRNKIETVPWHPNAPTLKTGEPIPNGCYFESHIGVSIALDQKESLEQLVSELNGGYTEFGQIELGGVVKLSQNFFKKSKDGSKFINMITYRNNMTSNSKFKEEVDDIKWVLDKSGFTYEKVEVEYAVYDTNVTHDRAWIMTT